MHCFMVACVQTTPTPLQFLLRDGGGDQKLQKVVNTIMNKEIMNISRRLLSRIVAFFLPPMLASL